MNHPIQIAKSLLLSAISLFLLGVPDLHAGGMMSEWMDKNGNSIEAEIIGYDFATKEVRWKLPNGSVAKSPLANLSNGSKWKALLLPGPIQDSAASRFPTIFGEDDIELTWVAVILFCVFLLALTLADFLCFKFAVRILDSPFRDLVAYLKLALVGFMFGILNQLILFLVSLANSEVFSNVMVVILFILSVFALLAVLVKHYEISFPRSLGLMLLKQFFLWITLTLFIWISTLIAYDDVDALVLRPLELI